MTCFRCRGSGLRWTVLFGLGFVACTALAAESGPRRSSPPSAAAAAWKRAKTVSPAIVDRYCRTDGPATYGVMIFKDRSGDIGGYQVTTSILDSPVHYFDALGAPLTLFHIFGPDAERTAADRIVKALRAAFPLQERLQCPATPNAGSPAKSATPPVHR